MRLRIALPAAALPAIAVFALLGSPVLAQAEGPSERTLGTTNDGKRVISMVIYGNDACPQGKDGEIVVCSRQPEAERYRLPKTFRKTDGKVEKSWKDQSAASAGVGAAGIGSCSAVGAAGSTGCTQQMMRAAREERRAKRAEEQATTNAVADQ